MAGKDDKLTYEIARDLLPRLHGYLREQLSKLLGRLDLGENVEIEIIDLLSEHQSIRKWMQFLNLNTNRERLFEGLGGKPSPSISSSDMWVCRRSDCNYTLPVIQAGESAPNCKFHDAITMILANQKKG